MSIFYVILVVIAAYFFIVFVLLRFVTPFMSFGGLKFPNSLPQEISNKITQLEQISQSQREYLEHAYKFIGETWHAGRMDTIFYSPLAFRKNITAVWSKPGYAHCNTQNYLLFLLLAGSKFFKPEDIILKTVFMNFFIHQYIKVKVAGQWIDADPAGASIRGLGLGKHISFFG